MDFPSRPGLHVREARLAQIEAVEVALDCAECALAGHSGRACRALLRRIADARMEADRLHRIVNRLSPCD